MMAASSQRTSCSQLSQLIDIVRHKCRRTVAVVMEVTVLGALAGHWSIDSMLGLVRYRLGRRRSRCRHKPSSFLGCHVDGCTNVSLAIDHIRCMSVRRRAMWRRRDFSGHSRRMHHLEAAIALNLDVCFVPVTSIHACYTRL